MNRLRPFTLAAVQHPGVGDLDLLEGELTKASLSSVSFINVGYKYKQNKSYVYLIQKRLLQALANWAMESYCLEDTQANH